MASSVELEIPDFGNSVLSSLNEQRLQGLYCDVTVVARGQAFRAHRAVLAASSAYFRDIFASVGAHGETPEAMVQVELPPAIQPRSFQQVLWFCYTGRLTMATCEQFVVMYTAGFLQIRGIVERGAELACSAAKVSSPRCDSQSAPQLDDSPSQTSSPSQVGPPVSDTQTQQQHQQQIHSPPETFRPPLVPANMPRNAQPPQANLASMGFVQASGAQEGFSGQTVQQTSNRLTSPLHFENKPAQSSTPVSGHQPRFPPASAQLSRIKLESPPAIIQCVPTHRRLYESYPPSTSSHISSKVPRLIYNGSPADTASCGGRGERESPKSSPVSYVLEEDCEEEEVEVYDEADDDSFSHMYTQSGRIDSLPSARGFRCELTSLPPDLLNQIGQRCHPQLYGEGDPGEKLELVSGAGVYIARGQLMNCHMCAGIRHKVLLRRLLAAFFDRTTLANSCGTGIRSSTNDPSRRPLDSRVLNAVKLYCQKFAPNFRESEMNVICADMCTNARRVRKRWLPKLEPGLSDRELIFHSILPDIPNYEGGGPQGPDPSVPTFSASVDDPGSQYESPEHGARPYQHSREDTGQEPAEEPCVPSRACDGQEHQDRGKKQKQARCSNIREGEGSFL
uniref:nucleus accumbens-associated protein 1-like isoform X2 n=1 Tax=Myxine glutinosa TaxID=7769 RepID=UPI00358DE6FE